MPRLEAATVHSQERAHDGGRRPLVAVGEGMVGGDAIGISGSFLRESGIELLAAERLERLGERRFQQAFVAHAVDVAIDFMDEYADVFEELAK